MTEKPDFLPYNSELPHVQDKLNTFPSQKNEKPRGWKYGKVCIFFKKKSKVNSMVELEGCKRRRGIVDSGETFNRRNGDTEICC